MLKTDLLVGAIGWNNDLWQNGFYPEELPQDWRLGYYSNHLRAVLVPAEIWRDPDTDAEQWLDDIYPEFRMVLTWDPGEADPLENVTEFLHQSSPIDANVDAYLVVLDRPADNSMERAIRRLSGHRPVSLVGRNYTAPDITPGLSEIPGIGQCWLPDCQDKPADRGRFLVALSGESNAKAIRGIIEEIDRWPDTVTDASGAALFFTGESGAEVAQQARTIAELMGV